MVVVGCCCFDIMLVIDCYCCCFFVVLFLLFCSCRCGSCCLSATQHMNRKTTKTLVSYCCLPFVPGRVLPRERPTTQNKKNKGLFLPPLFLILVVFLYFCVSFSLGYPFFYLFSFVFVLFCFSLPLSFFFHSFSSLLVPSNFKKAAKGQETMKKKKKRRQHQ